MSDLTDTMRRKFMRESGLRKEIAQLEAENRRLREAGETLVDRAILLARGKPVRDFDEAILCMERALCPSKGETGEQQ